MRGGSRLLRLVALIGVFGATTATALASTLSWGTAIEVPATAAPTGLNVGGAGYVNSVSCAVAGKCAAGGSYNDGSGTQAFVVDETNSGWGNAIEVPGTAALNAGGDAAVRSISCAGAGTCAAGGYYSDGSGYKHAFVADETHSQWGNAAAVRNLPYTSEVKSISCASAGNCAAGGYHGSNAFVVDEKNGQWGNAIAVPGLAALIAGGGHASVASISCGSTGYCSAGGQYVDMAGNGRAFVVSESPGGGWGHAVTVHNTSTLNLGNHAGVTAVSCAGPGACWASGQFGAVSGSTPVVRSFVVSKLWSWRQATRLYGAPSFNSASEAATVSVSCSAPDSCATGGFYQPANSSLIHAFVAESSGSFTRLWGVAAVSHGSQATSISCASPGNCVAGGVYYDGLAHSHGFLAIEKSDNWYAATQVPGLSTLSVSLGGGLLVSCAKTAGTCGVGGSYHDSSGHTQAFVTTP
jgi:hypothetical protein